MQLVGYPLYVGAGVLRVINFPHAGSWDWLLAYLLLGVAFHVGASAPDDGAYRRRRLGALAVMTLAVFAMEAIRPCPFGALALGIVASQAALVLGPREAALWAFALTMIVSYFLIGTLGWLFGVAEIIALVGFQGFAIAAIAAGRREAEARAALARTNAALVATRSLLDEATRAQERNRIARDLHDVLGHDLTALSLQLEIASHLDETEARAEAAKARELTSRLLQDLRAVVSAMRPDRAPGLVSAIRAMVVEVPGLAIHLDAPESLAIEEPSQATCVVRCVQEIVTNTRRHALGAENLWIRMRCEAGDLVVEAHDDGKGNGGVRDGHGLRGMRSRLEEMGGRLEIQSAPERAFALVARLPLRPGLGAAS
jgi:signal transduction histidine kinase